MTDPMMADKVYLLPLTVESIEQILDEAVTQYGFGSLKFPRKKFLRQSYFGQLKKFFFQQKGFDIRLPRYKNTDRFYTKTRLDF